MQNVAYVGLSRQMVLQREIDVIANNVANVDTTGFKVEALMVQSSAQKMGGSSAGSPLNNSVNFPMDAGVVRDFSQGELKRTGGDLDMAIQGEGFFKVQTQNGERYTRDGAFSVDDQGRIVTATGDPVEGDGGDITLDPKKGRPSISADGTVSQQGQVIGKISLVTFSSLSALSKDGGGLFSNDTNLQPQPATGKVRQGVLEQSNVQPIMQITQLIQVSRAYDNISQMMDTTDQLSSSAIDRLGKPPTTN
jgi:flagellar basal-body rod protein FlgF